jgi:hypothetical protein
LMTFGAALFEVCLLLYFWKLTYLVTVQESNPISILQILPTVAACCVSLNCQVFCGIEMYY